MDARSVGEGLAPSRGRLGRTSGTDNAVKQLGNGAWGQ